MLRRAHKRKVSKIQSIRDLITSAPQLASNRKALLLAYWTIVEGINIPQDVLREIMVKGSDPDCITRLLRFVKEELSHGGHI